MVATMLSSSLLPLLLLLLQANSRLTDAWDIDKALIDSSPSRYVRTTYRVGLDEAIAMTCSFRNTEASLGYFALGSEADFTGRMLIWQKVDSTGGEELIAIGSRVDPKQGAFHDYKVLRADATTSVLFIPRTTLYHDGYYKCSLSDGGFLHQMMHLNVSRPYMVMRHPLENSLYVPKGGAVHLQCTVKYGYPPPLIYWTHGRARIQKSVRPVAWGPTLSLNGMTEGLAGTYTCHADDFLRPPISTSFKVLLRKEEPGRAPQFLWARYNHEPARFSKKLPRYGHLYALTCSASGSPTVGFHWFKSSKNIKEMNNPNLSIHSATSKNGVVVSELQIRRFKLSDRGNYSCKAFNKHGSEHYDFALTGIEDLPTVLRQRIAPMAPMKQLKPPVDDDDYSPWSRSGSGSGEVNSKTTTGPAAAKPAPTAAPEISGSGQADKALLPPKIWANVTKVAKVGRNKRRIVLDDSER